MKSSNVLLVLNGDIARILNGHDLRDFFGGQVFETVIPRNVRLAEAPSYGKPVFLYDPECRGATSYRQLAQEVISHDQKSVGARA